MTRTFALLALAALALLLAATPALAHLHCVVRGPHGCVSQNHGGHSHGPGRITRVTGSASPVLFQPVLGQSGTSHGGHPRKHRPHGITITRQTNGASPVLFQHAH